MKPTCTSRSALIKLYSPPHRPFFLFPRPLIQFIQGVNSTSSSRLVYLHCSMGFGLSFPVFFSVFPQLFRFHQAINVFRPLPFLFFSRLLIQFIQGSTSWFILRLIYLRLGVSVRDFPVFHTLSSSYTDYQLASVLRRCFRTSLTSRQFHDCIKVHIHAAVSGA